MPDPDPSTVARAAFQRGDQLLQLVFPLEHQKAYIAPMIGGGTSSRRQDVNAHLNEVVNEGWALAAASVVFVQTGEESRDKFLSSGQNVAVSGEVVGYYLFARDDSKQSQRVARITSPTPSAPVPVRTRRTTSEIAPLAPLPEE